MSLSVSGTTESLWKVRTMKAHQRYGTRARLWPLGLVFLIGACAPGAVVGLRPEYPPTGQLFRNAGYDFVAVDSLQPTFRWEPFPREQDLAADKTGIFGQVTEAAYDLQIWRAGYTYQYPAERVYAKQGLTETSHRIEQPLAPATRYSWTVRARFLVNGEPRVTEWSMYEWEDARLRRPFEELFPSPRYFRFITPAQ
jgi:arylsulfatase A-like enzyme